jgi:phosphodiester glycosidase
MRSRPRLTAALLCALSGVLAAGLASPALSAAGSASTGGDDRQVSRTKHSSDGVRGKIAPPLPHGRRAANPVDTNWVSWPVAPGLTYTQWDRTDARGTIRAYLLAANLSQPGLSLDYLSPDEVPDREPVLDMVTDDAAVAGINGDFFDIADTGAPLGMGSDRDRGLLTARESGWNRGFYFTREGLPWIGDLAIRAWVKGRPNLRVGSVNSPTVADDRVGFYTRDWGRTVGTRVTDGQRTGVREVVVEKGRVVRISRRLSTDRKIRDVVLIGRGKAAKRLGWLKVGQKVRVKYKVRNKPQVVITGNKQLLDERIRTVVDDREMHPRTAIGIDRDTNTILMLVIDGRQAFSRGYTMVELANLMLELGAEDALNLDGGGSSTMVGLRPDGILSVLNSPSDGQQRPVPNGLQVSYTTPAVRR